MNKFLTVPALPKNCFQRFHGITRPTPFHTQRCLSLCHTHSTQAMLGSTHPQPAPHYYSKRGFTPSAGARFVQTPYAYENPYDAYAEDIQYSTVEPLMEPIPYTRQWQSGWGSANQGHDDAMGGWFADLGEKLKKRVGKGKTKRSARRSSRKAKRALRKRAKSATGKLDAATKGATKVQGVANPFGLSSALMRALSTAPALDAPLPDHWTQCGHHRQKHLAFCQKPHPQNKERGGVGQSAVAPQKQHSIPGKGPADPGNRQTNNAGFGSTASRATSTNDRTRTGIRKV